MKKITFLLFLLSNLAVTSQTITQSNSFEIGQISTYTGNAVNRYLRYFKLNNYQITQDYTISNVEFGISIIDDDGLFGGTFPITVKLYSSTEEFPYGFGYEGFDYILVAEETFNLPNQNRTIYSAPISATIPVGRNLLVEISYDLREVNNLTRVTLGYNDEGETAPSYRMEYSMDTGDTVYEISNENTSLHLIMSVTGTQSLGIEETVLETVLLYPNPAKNIINVQAKNIEINNTFITDSIGKKCNVDIKNNSIDISNLTSGIYFLTLESSEGNITKKIIKE